MSFDGFSLNFVIKDLEPIITSARISKIYQANKHTIYLYLSTSQGTKILSISINPDNTLINIVDSTLDKPAEPPVFCMVLRKQLEGGRIGKIQQIGLDRIIAIDIDYIGPKGVILTKTLVCELMGKHSNIILIQDGTIIEVLRRVGENNNRVRVILPGYPYELPPEQPGLSLLDNSVDEFIAAIPRDDTTTIYRGLLGVGLGFGPVTVEEILYRSQLLTDKNTLMKNLEDDQLSKLQQGIMALKAEVMTQMHPTLILNDQQRIKAMAVFSLHTYLYNPQFKTIEYPTITELCQQSIALQGNYILDDKTLYLKQVKQELNKAQRKLVKITKELEDTSKAELLRIYADNITTYMYQFTDRADKEITVPNIYSETGEMVTIPLDQLLSLNANAQMYYNKYDKQKRAVRNIEQQIAKCQENITYLLSVQDNLQRATQHNDIEAIRQELAEHRHDKKALKTNRLVTAASKPYKFTLPNGMTVFVGKNNKQNDKLSFKIAQKTDFWLHTKDIPGSHVILQTNGEEIDEENLRLVTQIAAYFSSARNSSNVPVDMVPVRYLRKPAGAKPGYVIFTHNRTLIVHPNFDEIKEIIHNAL